MAAGEEPLDHPPEILNDEDVNIEEQIDNPTVTRILCMVEQCQKSTSDDQINHLTTIWNEVSQNACQLPRVEQFFLSLFKETCKVVLSDQWRDVKEVVRHQLAYAIGRCGHKLNASVERAQKLTSALIIAVFTPWTDEASSVDLLPNEPVELVLARVEYLIASGNEDGAATLCSNYLRLNAPTIQPSEPDSTAEGDPGSANTLCPTGPEDSDLIPLLELFVLMLYRKNRITDIVKSTHQCSCHQGVRLVRNIQTKRCPESQALAQVLAYLFLVRDLRFPSKYCCTKELMSIWCTLQAEQCSNMRSIREAAKKLVVQHASNSAHFYLFVDMLWEKFGYSLFPLYVELYILGLTTDINHLEVVRNTQSQLLTMELEIHIAGVFVKLASLFNNGQEVVARECLLSAFSLEPTPERLVQLDDLYHTAEKRHCKVKEVPKEATPQMNTEGLAFMIQEQLQHNKQEPLHEMEKQEPTHEVEKKKECRCEGRCSTPTNLYDNFHFRHPILDYKLPGMSIPLMKDLVTVVEGIRHVVMRYPNNWEELRPICEAHLEVVSSLHMMIKHTQVMEDTADSETDSITEEEEEVDDDDVAHSPHSEVSFMNDMELDALCRQFPKDNHVTNKERNKMIRDLINAGLNAKKRHRKKRRHSHKEKEKEVNPGKKKDFKKARSSKDNNEALNLSPRAVLAVDSAHGRHPLTDSTRVSPQSTDNISESSLRPINEIQTTVQASVGLKKGKAESGFKDLQKVSHKSLVKMKSKSKNSQHLDKKSKKHLKHMVLRKPGHVNAQVQTDVTLSTDSIVSPSLSIITPVPSFVALHGPKVPESDYGTNFPTSSNSVPATKEYSPVFNSCWSSFINTITNTQAPHSKVYKNPVYYPADCKFSVKSETSQSQLSSTVTSTPRPLTSATCSTTITARSVTPVKSSIVPLSSAVPRPPTVKQKLFALKQVLPPGGVTNTLHFTNPASSGTVQIPISTVIQSVANSNVISKFIVPVASLNNGGLQPMLAKQLSSITNPVVIQNPATSRTMSLPTQRLLVVQHQQPSVIKKNPKSKPVEIKRKPWMRIQSHPGKTVFRKNEETEPPAYMSLSGCTVLTPTTQGVRTTLSSTGLTVPQVLSKAIGQNSSLQVSDGTGAGVLNYSANALPDSTTKSQELLAKPGIKKEMVFSNPLCLVKKKKVFKSHNRVMPQMLLSPTSNKLLTTIMEGIQKPTNQPPGSAIRVGDTTTVSLNLANVSAGKPLNQTETTKSLGQAQNVDPNISPLTTSDANSNVPQPLNLNALDNLSSFPAILSSCIRPPVISNVGQSMATKKPMPIKKPKPEPKDFQGILKLGTPMSPLVPKSSMTGMFGAVTSHVKMEQTATTVASNNMSRKSLLTAEEPVPTGLDYVTPRTGFALTNTSSKTLTSNLASPGIFTSCLTSPRFSTSHLAKSDLIPTSLGLVKGSAVNPSVKDNSLSHNLIPMPQVQRITNEPDVSSSLSSPSTSASKTTIKSKTKMDVHKPVMPIASPSNASAFAFSKVAAAAKHKKSVVTTEIVQDMVESINTATAKLEMERGKKPSLGTDYSDAAAQNKKKKKKPSSDHDMSPTSPRDCGITRARCEDCGRGLASAYNLKRHMKNVHNKLLPISPFKPNSGCSSLEELVSPSFDNSIPQLHIADDGDHFSLLDEAFLNPPLLSPPTTHTTSLNKPSRTVPLTMPEAHSLETELGLNATVSSNSFTQASSLEETPEVFRSEYNALMAFTTSITNSAVDVIKTEPMTQFSSDWTLQGNGDVGVSSLDAFVSPNNAVTSSPCDSTTLQLIRDKIEHRQKQGNEAAMQEPLCLKMGSSQGTPVDDLAQPNDIMCDNSWNKIMDMDIFMERGGLNHELTEISLDEANNGLREITASESFQCLNLSKFEAINESASVSNIQPAKPKSETSQPSSAVEKATASHSESETSYFVMNIIEKDRKTTYNSMLDGTANSIHQADETLQSVGTKPGELQMARNRAEETIMQSSKEAANPKMPETIVIDDDDDDDEVKSCKANSEFENTDDCKTKCSLNVCAFPERGSKVHPETMESDPISTEVVDDLRETVLSEVGSSSQVFKLDEQSPQNSQTGVSDPISHQTFETVLDEPNPVPCENFEAVFNEANSTSTVCHQTCGAVVGEVDSVDEAVTPIASPVLRETYETAVHESRPIPDQKFETVASGAESVSHHISEKVLDGPGLIFQPNCETIVGEVSLIEHLETGLYAGDPSIEICEILMGLAEKISREQVPKIEDVCEPVDNTNPTMQPIAESELTTHHSETVNNRQTELHIHDIHPEPPSYTNANDSEDSICGTKIVHNITHRFSIPYNNIVEEHGYSSPLPMQTCENDVQSISKSTAHVSSDCSVFTSHGHPHLSSSDESEYESDRTRDEVRCLSSCEGAEVSRNMECVNPSNSGVFSSEVFELAHNVECENTKVAEVTLNQESENSGESDAYSVPVNVKCDNTSNSKVPLDEKCELHSNCDVSSTEDTVHCTSSDHHVEPQPSEISPTLEMPNSLFTKEITNLLQSIVAQIHSREPKKKGESSIHRKGISNMTTKSIIRNQLQVVLTRLKNPNYTSVKSCHVPESNTLISKHSKLTKNIESKNNTEFGGANPKSETKFSSMDVYQALDCVLKQVENQVQTMEYVSRKPKVTEKIVEPDVVNINCASQCTSDGDCTPSCITLSDKQSLAKPSTVEKPNDLISIIDQMEVSTSSNYPTNVMDIGTTASANLSNIVPWSSSKNDLCTDNLEKDLVDLCDSVDLNELKVETSCSADYTNCQNLDVKSSATEHGVPVRGSLRIRDNKSSIKRACPCCVESVPSPSSAKKCRKNSGSSNGSGHSVLVPLVSIKAINCKSLSLPMKKKAKQRLVPKISTRSTPKPRTRSTVVP